MRVWSYWLLLGSCIHGGSAWSQESARRLARLTYQVQPTLESHCPDEKTFAQMVSARAGYEAFLPRSLNHLEVRIFQSAKTLQGFWRWQPSAGAVRVREFTGNRGDCLELVEQMVLATAVAFNPSVVLVLPTPAVTPEPAPMTESLKPIVWSLGAGLSMSYGLPQPALGVLVDAVGTRQGWAVGVETEWQNSFSTSISNTAAYQAFLWRLGAKACRNVQAFQGCVLLSGGTFWADSQGLTSPKFVRAPLFRSGLAVGMEHALSSSWAVRWAAIGECQPTRWLLRVGTDTVWESPWCSVGIRLQGVRRWSRDTL